MQYMISFFQPMSVYNSLNDPKEAEAYRGAWTAYVQAIRASGLVVSGAGLLPPPTGTSVRIRDGKRQVQDGPFADTKEHLGGYFVIEAPHLDAALEWAARAPSCSTGTTEVRPVMPPLEM